MEVQRVRRGPVGRGALADTTLPLLAQVRATLLELQTNEVSAAATNKPSKNEQTQSREHHTHASGEHVVQWTYCTLSTGLRWNSDSFSVLMFV